MHAVHARAVGIADQYLLRRVGAPLVAVVLVVGVVVSLWQLGRISSLVLMSYQDVGLLLTLIADLAPSFAGIALGTAGIFGCLVAYDRLADDAELTAFSAAGLPPRRIFAPAVLIGCVLGMLVLAAGVWGEPWGATHYGRDVAILATRSFSRSLRAGTFNDVGGLASVYVGSATTDEVGRVTWHDVVVGRDLAEGPMVLTTRNARVEPAGVGVVALETTAGEAILPSNRVDETHRLTFEKASISINVGGWVQSETLRLYAFQSLPLDALWEQAKNPSTNNLPDIKKLRHHLWQKLLQPFGIALLCILGALVGGQRQSQARSRAYIVSALCVAAYFGLQSFGRNLALQEIVPAWLGAGIPNLAAAALVLWIWRTRGSRWA